MRQHRLVPLLVAFTLGACDDRTGGVLDPDPPPIPATPISMTAPGTEGYAQRGEFRAGWIWDRAGLPREVRYEVQHGLAIWEGDIILGRVTEVAATRAELVDRPVRGSVITGDDFRWSGGVIPYEIDPTLTNQARVTNAIRWVEDQTPGVRVVPRNGEADYVTFQPSDGCSSAVGRQGGQQFINLATFCTTGNTAHEILHALGMFHEHSRCDRDDFVTINEDNIIEESIGNFDLLCPDVADDFFDYDEGSMMHYGAFAFAIDTSIPTIVSLRGLDGLMGQRSALGPTDVATIEALYGEFNLAPVAVIGPLEASYPEGSLVLLVGSGSFDDDDDDSILLYQWVFDGACPPGSENANCQTMDTQVSVLDNGSYDVELTVSDGFATSLPAQATVVVHNLPPEVNAGADATISSGEELAFVGQFRDFGILDNPWEWEIDWGDGETTEGSTDDQGELIEASHQFCAAGSYTVQLAVTDKDGDTGTDDMTVTVLHVPVEIVIQPDSDPTPVNLRRGGVLPVAILSSATLDATTLDPATLTLGDGLGADTPIALKNNGEYEVSYEDVNGDGLIDLVARFRVQDLVGNGDLDATTTELVLRALLGDGCTHVLGSGPIDVRP